MQQTHHTLDYIEIHVTDMDVAKAFYTQAFGWRLNDYGPAYAGIASPDGDGEVGGLNADGASGPGGVFPLVFSEDLDASVEAVRAAGGEVSVEPYDYPGGRRFHFRDPSGNELGVYQPSDA
jgi:predicted enzyme related to lactoylglutathione lyase